MKIKNLYLMLKTEINHTRKPRKVKDDENKNAETMMTINKSNRDFIA